MDLIVLPPSAFRSQAQYRDHLVQIYLRLRVIEANLGRDFCNKYVVPQLHWNVPRFLWSCPCYPWPTGDAGKRTRRRTGKPRQRPGRKPQTSSSATDNGTVQKPSPLISLPPHVLQEIIYYAIPSICTCGRAHNSIFLDRAALRRIKMIATTCKTLRMETACLFVKKNSIRDFEFRLWENDKKQFALLLFRLQKWKPGWVEKRIRHQTGTKAWAVGEVKRAAYWQPGDNVCDFVDTGILCEGSCCRGLRGLIAQSKRAREQEHEQRLGNRDLEISTIASNE